MMEKNQLLNKLLERPIGASEIFNGQLLSSWFTEKTYAKKSDQLIEKLIINSADAFWIFQKSIQFPATPLVQWNGQGRCRQLFDYWNTSSFFFWENYSRLMRSECFISTASLKRIAVRNFLNFFVKLKIADSFSDRILWIIHQRVAILGLKVASRSITSDSTTNGQKSQPSISWICGWIFVPIAQVAQTKL